MKMSRSFSNDPDTGYLLREQLRQKSRGRRIVIALVVVVAVGALLTWTLLLD